MRLIITIRCDYGHVLYKNVLKFVVSRVLKCTSTLRLLAMRGLRTLCVRRVALRAPGVTQSNIFWIFSFKYCEQRSTNNFSYGSENIIFEIYTPKTPHVTRWKLVSSRFLGFVYFMYLM